MSQSETSAYARVKLEVEISVNSSWGGDCSIDQVHRQAAEEAIGFIENKVCREADIRLRMKIVGQPIISAVIVERKKP